MNKLIVPLQSTQPMLSRQLDLKGHTTMSELQNINTSTLVKIASKKSLRITPNNRIAAKKWLEDTFNAFLFLEMIMKISLLEIFTY